jgi:hypothetical protein
MIAIAEHNEPYFIRFLVSFNIGVQWDGGGGVSKWVVKLRGFLGIFLYLNI